LGTHLLFIDCEKAFDNMQRQIVDIYTKNKIMIKFNNKLSNSVDINKGVRQGFPL